MADVESMHEARQIMEQFAQRTGLAGSSGDLRERYLWTDAFAVQAFLGLSRSLDEPQCRDHALKLVDTVHAVLGRHRADDSRTGWISGLPEEEGLRHPTIGGLRIGKPLPERSSNEKPDESIDWDRDGQYFHYLTRWCQALLAGHQETGAGNLAGWAVELLNAGEQFVDATEGRLRMYWKMNIDLSAPVVRQMGAHDPLDGLICAERTADLAPDRAADLERFTGYMKALSAGQSWATTDALGIGGLLLNAARASVLQESADLPDSASPRRLMDESLRSLEAYAGHAYRPSMPAEHRLAFRECGLSLGLRVLAAMLENRPDADRDRQALARYLHLADELEDFWREPGHQQAGTWSGHRNINAVTLASSLVARHYPVVFC